MGEPRCVSFVEIKRKRTPFIGGIARYCKACLPRSGEKVQIRRKTAVKKAVEKVMKSRSRGWMMN
jgi:hypothetical protein